MHARSWRTSLKTKAALILVRQESGGKRKDRADTDRPGESTYETGVISVAELTRIERTAS